MAHLFLLLTEYDVWSATRRWVGDRTLEKAWVDCERGAWLLALAARAEVDRKLIVLAACACARASLQYVPDGEDRPRLAIETAEAWARGEASLPEVRQAASGAYEAASEAYAVAANGRDTASEAYAAYEASLDAAATAAVAGADSSTSSTYNLAAMPANRLPRQSADIVRKHISVDMIRAGLEAAK